MRRAVILLALGSLACMWDYDTLRQERARFPGTLELITGKFLRHSPEFYAWRVRDRTARLAREPNNLALLDDLAVAQAKLGDPKTAIETMHRSETLAPSRYETHANLGTFELLAGDAAAGIAEIDHALAINPDAHFGRERYQKWLAEYILAHGGSHPLGNEAAGFASFVAAKAGIAEREGPQRADALAKATKGVLGMMRFARHDDPYLLEALGDLLSDDSLTISPGTDAKLLAARAYLAASYLVVDPDAKQAYRKRAMIVLSFQTAPESDDPIELAEVEDELRDEMFEANAWFATVRARELGWIAAGGDVDAAYDRFYATEPLVDAELNAEHVPLPRLGWVLLGVAGFAVAAGAMAVWRRLIRARRTCTGTVRRNPW